MAERHKVSVLVSVALKLLGEIRTIETFFGRHSEKILEPFRLCVVLCLPAVSELCLMWLCVNFTSSFTPRLPVPSYIPDSSANTLQLQSGFIMKKEAALKLQEGCAWKLGGQSSKKRGEKGCGKKH